MISPAEYMQGEEENKILSPNEYMKDVETKILSLDEYMRTESMPSVLSPEQYNEGLAKPKPAGKEGQWEGWIKPTLKEAGKTLIPYLKYVDPEERERFMELSQQKQTRELLLQDLEAIGLLAFQPIAKGIKPVVAETLKKYLPKTYKFFTKARKARKIKPVIPKTKEVPETPDDLFKKIIGAIEEAGSKRKVQEQIYTQERAVKIKKAMAAGEKATGEKRFPAMLRELKGEMTKVEFESLRVKFGQKEIDKLFEMIWDSPKIKSWEHATAYRGLAKLFGKFGGSVPQDSELELLGRVFPKELIKALIKKRGLFKRMKEGRMQLANIPRSIMASFDLSAPFRQGLFLISHPKRFGQSFIKMFRQFGSEKAFNAVQESIAQKETFGLMKEAGLQLTKLGKQLSLREEAYMSQWAEKIPLIGRVVRASGRAHMGFLNKLRADVFEDLVKKAAKLGRDPRKNMDLAKEIAKFVNVASGRGTLGGLESSAVTLNAMLFSPRLIASRLTLLNPVYYIKADPFVRKEALKSLLAVSGLAGTVLGLAKAGGADVGLDPRSADFLKIKIGKTRIDVLGGVQQYMRAVGQIVSGKYISSTTGKIFTLGEGYRPLTRWEIGIRFGESKLAPIASFVMALMKGQDIEGKPGSVPKEIGKRFVPMAMADIYDIAKENPELLPISWLGIFGVGLQTYGPRKKKRKGIGGIRGL